MKQWCAGKNILLKDSTLREGLDVPGINLSVEKKSQILDSLLNAGVCEVELVAPGHFERDLLELKKLKLRDRGRLKFSGLIFASEKETARLLTLAKQQLDRLDVLLPLAEERPPHGRDEKRRKLHEVLTAALDLFPDAGVGFPHATQTEEAFLLEMCKLAIDAGAQRVTLYDTNGSLAPWEVTSLITKAHHLGKFDLCFHAHNDLGLATANALAAVYGGATCLDVTVNGLGDRAGNASLEQVAISLQLAGASTGLKLDSLHTLCHSVATLTSTTVSPLAPVVGDFAFCHKSPAHLNMPGLFEAFDPSIVGTSRSIDSGKQPNKSNN